MRKIKDLVNYYDLFYDLINNKEEIKSIDDVITLAGTVKRRLMLGAVEDGTGSLIHSFVSFWNEVDDEAGLAPEERDPIILTIDSPGGSLVDGFTSVDAIRMSKTPVYTVNIGAAYSAGLLIYLAGHKRFCYPHSSFLLHEGSAGMSGEASTFINFTSFYKRQLDQLKQIVLDTSNITEEEYEKIRKEDNWFDADQALEKGLADEILTKFI